MKRTEQSQTQHTAHLITHITDGKNVMKKNTPKMIGNQAQDGWSVERGAWCEEYPAFPDDW